MFNSKSFLGIIPARGGSKRLPNKNLLNLCGTPLISWSIESGIKSQYIDHLVVTSDDDLILEEALKYNIKVIKRPCDLATDLSLTTDVIHHVLQTYSGYDYIVLLQPTSPLRNQKDIDQAIEYLDDKQADAVISVCEENHSPMWCHTLPKNHSMINFVKNEFTNKRSQDIPAYYRLNGAIYICCMKRFLKERTLFIKDNIFAFIMSREKSIDIDTELDFQFAQFIMNKYNINLE